MQGCIVASQLLVLALLRWWPAPGAPDVPDAVYHTSGQEVIRMEEILPTRQAARTPPPPPPLLPVVVPNDVVLDTAPIIDAPMLTLEEYGDEDETVEGEPEGGAASAAPEVGPRPLRFVEPEYTREARRNRVRAEVVVQVLVDEKGVVREAEVVERYLLSGSDGETRERVDRLDYGLEGAALAAAERWMFQPARQGGTAVQSYTTLTFRFGV